MAKETFYNLEMRQSMNIGNIKAVIDIVKNPKSSLAATQLVINWLETFENIAPKIDVALEEYTKVMDSA